MNEPAASSTRRFIPELDGVRGLAIAMVMAHHFINGGITPDDRVEWAAVKLTNYGLWGVDLFFVLSGFLITGILADSRARSGQLKHFFARRALRIFPLYYAVLLVLLVLVPGSMLARLDPEFLELRRLQVWLWPHIANFYLGPQTDFNIPYLSHFWSLAVEEHFYLFWPFIVWFLPRQTAMRTCIGLGGMALALRIWFSYVAPDQLYAGVLTPARIDSLLAGSWFALAVRRPQGLTSAESLRWMAVGGAGVVLLSMWQIALPSHQAVVLPLRTSVLALFFAAMIHLVATSERMPALRAAFRQAWLRNLGRYSYGLYVFHAIVSYGMHRMQAEALFERWTGHHTPGAILQVSTGVAVSYALAWVSFHVLESPFLALKSAFDDAAPARPRVPATVVSSGTDAAAL